ncbi:hypothetical protein ACERK3_05070 [Phycisphaerales bacterium AB-hyl4]|uniref:Uncharacterized protein n=1 Tax=Natronomicrosphaera hydrolytica TaxID=3242702 RepID=A0ABV4U228_9BACT
MFGKQLWSIVFALGLAFGGVSLVGCEQDAGDHLDDAGDNIQDAGDDVGDAFEQGADDAGDAFD